MIQLLFRGGYTMIPIVLCSILAVAVIIERGISLRRKRVLPPGLEARPPEGDGEFLADGSPLGRVLALAYRNRGLNREENYEIVQHALKETAGRLERGLVLLEIVAVISPLLGLLGTVIGMVQVFNVISVIGAGHAQALSGGISQALITTIAGLVVAIPALVAYSIYTRRVDNLLLEIEGAATLLLQRLYPPSRKATPIEDEMR